MLVQKSYFENIILYDVKIIFWKYDFHLKKNNFMKEYLKLKDMIFINRKV